MSSRKGIPLLKLPSCRSNMSCLEAVLIGIAVSCKLCTACSIHILLHKPHMGQHRHYTCSAYAFHTGCTYRMSLNYHEFSDGD
jgi:hypothetical protein